MIRPAAQARCAGKLFPRHADRVRHSTWTLRPAANGTDAKHSRRPIRAVGDRAADWQGRDNRAVLGSWDELIDEVGPYPEDDAKAIAHLFARLREYLDSRPTAGASE